METVNFIAQLWGFSLIIIALSLLLKTHSAKNILHMLENENVLFLHGVLGIVLGVSMLLNYNTWDASWKVIITVLGWLLLASGIGLLYVPSFFSKLISKLKNSNWLSNIPLIVILFGCLLLYMSFNA